MGPENKTAGAGQASGQSNSQPGGADRPPLEANFSTLILSIASSAAMALGLGANPATGKIEKDLNLARFNIDLLRMLKDKTKGNLNAEEQRFIETICTDLQMKFVQAK